MLHIGLSGITSCPDPMPPLGIGLTQLPSFNARRPRPGHRRLRRDPDRPVIHLSGGSAIGFSSMEMETLVRDNFPVKIVGLNHTSDIACNILYIHR